MKLTTIPKEVACELLVFIAEKESFSEVVKTLGDEFSVPEIKAMLRELAVGLQKELLEEDAGQYNVKKCKHLTKNSKKIISYLSPNEESKLLKTFGLLSDK